MSLFHKWISLLSLRERVHYGVIPEAQTLYVEGEQTIMTCIEAGKNVCGFTLTPGKHCIFTMGLCTRPKPRFTTFVGGLLLEGTPLQQIEAYYRLKEEGYHFYPEVGYKSFEHAQDALFQLRRTALNLK